MDYYYYKTIRTSDLQLNYADIYCFLIYLKISLRQFLRVRMVVQMLRDTEATYMLFMILLQFLTYLLSSTDNIGIN
jgi:hypothetical protein